jgi:hypothetical protein
MIFTSAAGEKPNFYMPCLVIVAVIKNYYLLYGDECLKFYNFEFE